METIRQETDTISRMIYGLATAFLMTGEDRYLEAAEAGTKHLREHFRNVDVSENVTYWYHAVDEIAPGKYKKIFASEFQDDADAIPAYEQIYALAGPTQTFRVNGDPAILNDIEMMVNLFDKCFLDKDQGGYWSHIDPITFDGQNEVLGKNRARKNWNSVGDHTPAYLINAYLATGDERYKNMLEYTADLVVNHFPDYENSPFVEEKFHADWAKDKTWGWQQNRAVVGHNLKIAWNLMRVKNAISKEKYVEMAEKIAALMPEHGMDKQRGGWYDVVSRMCAEGEDFHRFAWHDRKAWWQQEQGILAYYILAGILNKPEYLKLARESASFYNAWFPDQDSGGVYFNVLANGLPYLLGTERLKASHSMSGYHSFELCYLCAVYTNLLVNKQPMDFYFMPLPHGFKDNILRVQPDLLPAGSIKIDKVWINGKEYKEFDAEALTVKLPETNERQKIRVRIIPIGLTEDFNISAEVNGSEIKVFLQGNIEHKAVEGLRGSLADVYAKNPERLVLDMEGRKSLCHEGVNAIKLCQQKLSNTAEIIIVKANQEIKALFTNDDFVESVIFID
jgi:mannose/cellobiose epimerase-like protein (N-acyl-D-glucosamine 2-epimerase family)